MAKQAQTTLSLEVASGRERPSGLGVVLCLPWPPTVNTYRVPRPDGKGFFLTSKAKRFKEAVALLVSGDTLKGELRLDVTLCPPDRRKRDVDNYVKPLFDAMQCAGVFEDDYQISEFTARRSDVVKGGMVRVEIQEC